MSDPIKRGLDWFMGTMKTMDDDRQARERAARNRRVQARYDELMREGKHGHYETMFRVVREEVERTQGEDK